MRQKLRRPWRRALVGGAGGFAVVIGQGSFSEAAAQPLVNVCNGPSVTVPVLQPVPGTTSGLLGGLLDPVLNGVVSNINSNITSALSGQPLNVAVVDQNGNVVTPGNCNIAADSLTINASKGITLGGGNITGLGGPGNPPASAGEINSIALGNGATTDAVAASAVAVGQNGSVTATDGVALGRAASVSAVGGVALGAGSVALRPGLAGGPESFSGTVVSSTAGAVSVGTAGTERQIVNLAGGTQDTDAVNVRQLRAVGSNLATSLGGGASFNVVTGAYTGPTYTVGGNTFTDVGSALNALNSSTFFGSTPIAANNTSALAAPTASGNDALAVGFGASSAGQRTASLGAGASATAADSVALGAGSVAARAGLAGATEGFSGATVSSTAGAVSVGAVGAERQVVNLAGGTQDTDAVNVRQLRAVGTELATSLGGGASFNASTGAYTGPTYTIGGNAYTDVGSALSALNSSTFFGNAPIVANNTSGFAAPAAAGSDALAAGFGASSSGARAASFGAGAVASGDGSSAFGANASATATDGVALGHGAAVSSTGGVALGAGSLATRSGLAGAAESFSGAAVASTAGAVSVGAAGAERQIVNVAGGTQDTDAVNVRQLRTVGSELATGLGGGASFNSTTGAYTGPTYVIGGNTYADVGAALSALNSSTFFGNNPIAANNTSGFASPTATGADALAVGYGASSAGARAASFGTGATASGEGGSAFGANASASAQNGTSVGSQSVASGVGATAVGAGATAAADATVAVGSAASATHTGSTAIGAGATTTRANQVAVGTQQSTYTMAGIGSAQSVAAQNGPTRFVTSDAAGNLATSAFDPGAITNQLNGLTQDFAALRKETRQGVASAMAMGAAPMPSAPGKTSWAINTATYMGEWGASISLAHRLNIPANVALTGSISNSGGNSFGVRVGLAGEF
jgi:autotransporter adhesin